jgi:hypothetical protein
MGCRMGCLLMALLAAVLIGVNGVERSATFSQLAELACPGRVEVAPQPGLDGYNVFCVDEGSGRRSSIQGRTIVLASLAFFAVLVIPAFVVGGIYDRAAVKAAAELARREAEAELTDAIIMRVERGINGKIGWVELILTFQVNDPHRQTYQARTAWMVREDQRQRAEIGQLVQVKINPAHPQQIFPDVDWAILSDFKARLS